MSDKNELMALYPTLALVFFSTLVIMFVYEFTKHVFSPAITIWESHIITIIFTSVIAVIIVYFPLRSLYREQQKTREALRHQQEAEENLRTSEMQYRSFVESVEDSIYAVDREGRYLLMNTRHLARRGLSAMAFAGNKYGDFHSAEETRVFENELRKVIANKSPVQDEFEQNGKYYLRKLSPVIDPVANEVIAITVVSSDITERRKIERNLETTNRKLNLVNDITRHDMLNQLTVLNSLIALADEQCGDPATKKYLLRSEQVVDTIQAQILFARDYQKIGLESPKWQSITSTIQKSRLPLKLTSVIIDESCNDREIFADLLLEKVFYNLLENALRYAGPRAEIRFSAIEEPDRLLLVCEDNGPGVPQENKEKIFQRGFGKNSGLGLFLIREIFSMTGITIHETGVEGEGSRFEISVPVGVYRQGTPG
jgi:PAS domain S-box-containing protein